MTYHLKESGRTKNVASTESQLPDAVRLASLSADRHEGIDALYCFCASRPLNDKWLLEYAFSQDAQLDVDLPVSQGKQTIVTSIIEATDTVTNPRVTMSSERAHMMALVEAQQLPKGDSSFHLRLKNWYGANLIQEGSQWRMRHVGFINI